MVEEKKNYTASTAQNRARPTLSPLACSLHLWKNATYVTGRKIDRKKKKKKRTTSATAPHRSPQRFGKQNEF